MMDTDLIHGYGAQLQNWATCTCAAKTVRVPAANLCCLACRPVAQLFKNHTMRSTGDNVYLACGKH